MSYIAQYARSLLHDIVISVEKGKETLHDIKEQDSTTGPSGASTPPKTTPQVSTPKKKGKGKQGKIKFISSEEHTKTSLIKPVA